MNALVQAALLGTARKPPPEPELPGRLSVTGPDERRVLREAAATALYQDAGALPERVRALPEPAPEEDRPLCSPRAAEHLAMILHGPYFAVLPEWLEALAESGRVIPHEHIPWLLRLDVATALEPVLSRRARWLAAQMGIEWAMEGDLKERWETGSRATRMHLARVRPAEVAPLLRATWKHESAADREAFLQILGGTLGEDFLRQALEDRAQGVRKLAARLLEPAPQAEPERELDKDGPPPGGRWSAPFTRQVAAWDDAPPRWWRALGVHGDPDVDVDPHTEAGALLAFRRTMLEELRR